MSLMQDVIENLSRILAKVPPLIFTIFGSMLFIALLSWVAYRQIRRIRRGSQISVRYRDAQDLYDTAIRVRNRGDRELALSCMQKALFIYEQIGVNGEQRALIERAIRELKEQEDSASAQAND